MYFFNSVLLTVQIIVIRTVPCICHGIFGIDPIQAVEFLHQGHKTVCVGSVLLPAQFFRMSVRYLLTSIPSMNRSNTITGSVTERNSSLLWYIILLRYGFHCKWVIPQKKRNWRLLWLLFLFFFCWSFFHSPILHDARLLPRCKRFAAIEARRKRFCYAWSDACCTASFRALRKVRKCSGL